MKKQHKLIKHGDIGTKELRRHKKVDTYIDEDGQLKARVRHSTIQEMYLNRNKIGGDHKLAADKLYSHYYYGIANPIGTKIANMERVASIAKNSMNLSESEWQYYNHDMYIKAMKNLNPRQIIVIKLVICEQNTVSDVSRNTRHAAEQMQLLKEALGTLVKHFYKYRN